MNNELKDKLAKIYALVNQGVDGEKEAAKLALDRLIKKYNLSDSDIESIHLKKYDFKYSNNLELWLLSRIAKYFLPEKDVTGFRQTYKVRQVVMSLEYVDFVVLSTAYEYFRRHMMAQYKKVVLPQVKRCRTAKTKNARRAELQDVFFSRYIIASNLYKKEEITITAYTDLSTKEIKALETVRNIEGGSYSTQVTTGLYLE